MSWIEQALPFDKMVTVTAAINTAATLTIPAAGAGLFHYIGALFIVRTATTAVAGTANLVITSTNLDSGNAWAWSVGNAVIAGGTQRDLELLPCFPIKSFAANTNTTIVMPIPGATSLWRAFASYYVAP